MNAFPAATRLELRSRRNTSTYLSSRTLRGSLDTALVKSHGLSHRIISAMPSRADRLAQIRALRAAGKTGFDAYEVQDAESIYETVDDEAYKKVVRSRLDQDDFVVDDNGEGYADDGREDWQDERQVYDESESEEDLPKHSKAGETCLRRVKLATN